MTACLRSRGVCSHTILLGADDAKADVVNSADDISRANSDARTYSYAPGRGRQHD